MKKKKGGGNNKEREHTEFFFDPAYIQQKNHQTLVDDSPFCHGSDDVY